MNRLTDRSVLGELLEPVAKALAGVRDTGALARVLSMTDCIGLGVLRHLQGMRTLREPVQSLLHRAPDAAQRVPLARSTGSDALASGRRRAVLQAVMGSLRTPAQGVLPDPLAGLPGLEARAVYAMDGTYQHESARYGRRTPHQGGEDHPKGHARLSFYDVRLGVPADVSVATRNRHETALRRDYDQGEQALTGHQGARWLVDRGFIEARFWDQKKRRLGITTITRMRRGLRIDSTEDLPVAELPVNAGVETDLQVTLSRSRALWRLIGYRTRRGHRVEFLTNELALQPGLLAFLYARRWEEAPCFATWKHDFSQAKAWGAHRVAIDNPVRLAMIASILVALRLHRQMGQYGIDDEQALRKQDRRQTSKTDGTERPDWSTPLFRYTSKVSRQVVRFFKHGFHKPASQALYESQLRPMLVAYL